MKKQPNQVFITIAKTDEGTSHGKPSWCLAWYNSSTVDLSYHTYSASPS